MSGKSQNGRPWWAGSLGKPKSVAPQAEAPTPHDEAVERNVKYLLRAKLSESRNTEFRTALETVCLNHNLGKNWRFPDGCVCAGCSLLRRIDHSAEVTK